MAIIMVISAIVNADMPGCWRLLYGRKWKLE